jgi:hypothetical protein
MVYGDEAKYAELSIPNQKEGTSKLTNKHQAMCYTT